MDSSITQGYENPDNVTDVSKEIAYPADTMDFTQDSFTTNETIPSEGFHIAGDPYQVNQPTEYNPIESVEHIQYEHQGQPNLGNISSEGYYSTSSETHYHSSYISEQTQESNPTHRNNGLNEVNNEQYIENVDLQTSVSAEGGSSNKDMVDINFIDAPTEVLEGSSVKGESEITLSDKNLPENQNGEKSTDNQIVDGIENNEITNNQEGDVIKDSDEDAIKKENLIEVVSETDKCDMEQEIVTETVVGETASFGPTPTGEFTELQTYEPQNDHYTIVEKESTGNSSSQKESEFEISQETVHDEMNIDEQDEQAQDNLETTEKKTRKTRKPVHDLPMHLIGHDINKPVDPVQNGRSLPKPRLGVKVPYRNLTSQIVSKAELEEVIIERSRAKELSTNKSDVKFARSLTQRLANKIAPEKTTKPKDKKPKETSSSETKKTGKRESFTIERQVEQIETEEGDTQSQGSSGFARTVDESKIQNDDDLLAILEGEGEEMPVLPKEVPNDQTDDTNLKTLEREIALQQLQELPYQQPTERILKPRFNRAPPLKQEVVPNINVDKSKSLSSSSSNSRSASASSSKANTSPKKSPHTDIDVRSSPKKEVDVEPQVKVNMVLKTYSRKRKPSDLPEFEMPSPKRSTLDDADISLQIETPKSDPLALPSDTYITKSSRIIKKKVIWDPDDEQTVRSPKVAAPKAVDTRVNVAKAVKPVPTPKTSSPEKKPTLSVDKKSTLSVDKKSNDKEAEKSKLEPKDAKSSETNSSKVTPKKVVKKSPVNKPKRGLSEVDRLLMDEGAVKMLYDLKNDDSPSEKKKKSIYSVEKAEKDIIKKANLLKNDLVQNTTNESTKTLRKKEGPGLISPPAKPVPILERKMSKDSTKSSVHTPPRSPTLFSSQSSMLIRRRSSSSISSEDEQYTPKTSKTSKVKKQKKSSLTKEDKKENVKTPTKDSAAKPVKGVQYKSFTMKKSGKHVAIDLNYIDDKCYFTIQVLEELISALKKSEKDKDCNVVSLTSTSKSFCLGLDYSCLVIDGTNERIGKATELAETVREFLLCLVRFPKILVAGIQSECVGLGVVMLTLFDSVIASDTATFSAPYASLGCVGEATFLLRYPNLSNNGLAAELLYASQTLKADEVFRRGLISKLCWPEKYKETLKNFLGSIAKGSQQSLERTKNQLRASFREEIEAAIDSETDVLIEHWTSEECQENFSKITT